MYHPNELDQQIENLRTLQQSYDQIAGAAEAYNVGKTQLAAAITSKGVETSPTETYPEMAEKVNAISQETYEINGGEMYAKQLFGVANNDIVPGYWNLYDVLAQLLSDGRLVNYGGILLAEYYKGYDSLALSGAGSGGAYVVSDKDGNGNFIMYTEDTTHTWNTEDDGKGNRWVAYCFADEYHDFQITDTNTSPRSIFIGRKVGTITSLVNGRVSEIVVTDGNELGGFKGNFTQSWNKKIVLRNISCASGSMIYGNTASESLYADIKQMTGGIIVRPTTQDSFKSIICHFNQETISGGSIVGTDGNLFCNCSYFHISGVKNIHIPSSGGMLFSGAKNNNTIYIFENVEEIVMTNMAYGLIQSSGAKELRLINIDYADVCLFRNASCPKIYISYKPNYSQRTVKLYYISSSTTDIELKDGWCKPINISAFSTLTEDGVTNNITEHILKKLKQDEPDCGDGVTIKLGSTNLAKLTSAESVQLLDDLTNIYGYTFA